MSSAIREARSAAQRFHKYFHVCGGGLALIVNRIHKYLTKAKTIAHASDEQQHACFMPQDTEEGAKPVTVG